MLTFPNGGRLVTSADELPDVPARIERLYADFETTSCDDRLDSLNPWHHCWAAGVAVTWDDVPGAWYIPVRHRRGQLIPREVFREWWYRVLMVTEVWVNHHVKYDAHVSCRDLGWVPSCKLSCTVVRSKIFDSDRAFRGGYGLDALALGLLGEDIRPFEQRLKSLLGDSKDYGSVAAEDMAEYACQDSMTTRRLDKYLIERTPAECQPVVDLEESLTPVLLAMERTGMVVDPQELKIAEYESLLKMNHLHGALHARLGRHVNPTSPEDCFDVLCNQFGLPVLGWTDEDEEGNPAGNPSFDKYAMAAYAVHPEAPHDVVDMISEYRQLSTFKSLFLGPYQELVSEDGCLHPAYNQMLRTGRMGCVDPNAQQLNKLAKALIKARQGMSILHYDQSQIEFRVIVHYINDQRCIEAYRDNPDTDFHDWVAEMTGMKRKPAKTMNFRMAFGGGKKRIVKSMAANTDVVGGIIGHVDQLVAEGRLAEGQRQAMFEELCRQRGEAVYSSYHSALPTLKPTARRASAVCAERGYVYNLYGRRRHLPTGHSHKAFNTLCQGCAADIQKDRTVAVSKLIEGTGIEMFANVHDANAFYGPTEVINDPRTRAGIAYLLERPTRSLRVPLRVSCGWSDANWREADQMADDLKGIKYDPQSINPDDPLEHLRFSGVTTCPAIA